MKRIPLSQGKEALVSDRDFARLNKIKWHARFDRFNWYAARNITISPGRRMTNPMHVFIMGKQKGLEIDHRNGNGLDNQRKNLRFVTLSQNRLNSKMLKTNTSGYRGVSWHGVTQMWMAKARWNGKEIYLGVFSKKSQAKSAYEKFTNKHYKKFKRK